MKVLSKLAGIAAGVLAAAGLNMAANAALVVTSPDLSTTLDFGNPISIDNDSIPNGVLVAGDNTGSFFVAPDVIGADGTVDVRFSSGQTAGVKNMVITFDVDGIISEFMVTDAAGRQILESFTLAVVPGVEVFVSVSGLAFGNAIQQANYNIFIQAVPVPAAGLILLTGLAGVAGVRMRKKVAA